MKKRDAVRGDVLADLARLEGRIAAHGRRRNRFGNKFVYDMDEAGSAPYPYGWTGNSRLSCYRLRAGNLELYEGLWVLP